MDFDAALDQTLALLGGHVREASGATLSSSAARPLLLGRGEGAAAASEALAAQRRVAIVVHPSGHGLARLLSRLTLRRQLAGARRRLAATGATRVRAIAVVPGGESLFLLYELDGRAQAYAESRMLLRPPQAAWVRAVKWALRLAAGVDTDAEFVVVVGERA